MIARRLALIAFAVSACGLASCSKGDGRKPTFPVSGTVTDGTKGIPNALVILHPVGEDGPDVVRPRGTTGADGTFTLTTYDGNDGAPAGQYRVAVTQVLAGARPEDGPKNRLPEKYGSPKTSNLTAEVTAGRTVLKPIEVRR